MKFSKVPYGYKSAYKTDNAIIFPPTPHSYWCVVSHNPNLPMKGEFKTLRAAKNYIRFQVQYYCASFLEQLELI